MAVRMRLSVIAVATAGLALTACGSSVVPPAAAPAVAPAAAPLAASSNDDCGDGLPADASFAPSSAK